MVGAANILFATEARSVWGATLCLLSNEQQGHYYIKTAETCG